MTRMRDADGSMLGLVGEAVAEDDSDGGADRGRMVRDAEAKAPIDAKRFPELVIEAREDVRAGWGVGLGVVLGEDLSVDAGVLLEVVAEGERLLPPVGASGPELAVGLNQGAIHHDVKVALRAVVVVREENDLLAVTLEDGVGGGGEFGLVLGGESGQQVMVVLSMELYFSAECDGADTVGVGAGVLLVREGGKVEIESEAGEGRIGEQCVEGLLVARDALGVGIVTGFNLKDSRALDGCAIGDSGAGWVEGEVLGVS
jgi:hypothetical protein